MFGNIVELIGKVYPMDFTNRVTLVRDCVSSYVVTRQTNGVFNVIENDRYKARGSESIGNDPTEQDFLDTDPCPDGRVFDVDSPGLQIRYPAMLPHGTVAVARYNFLQYASWGARRCSNDFAWHSRTRVVRNDDDTFPDLDFVSRQNNPYDNCCGEGHLEVSQ